MPGEEISIVEASEDDVDAVAEFFWRAWKEAGPEEPGWTGVTDEALRELTARDNLLRRISGPGRRMFLAKEGSQVVGFSANRHVDKELVELAGIVVLRGLRGRGLGSRLLDVALQAARDDGYSRVRVRTEASNERVIEFYRSKGFEFVQTVTDEVGDVLVEGWELARDL
jgi:ribosomal protein S18 acetylase RimI-like enzyme